MEMQKLVSFALLSHRTFCAPVNNKKYFSIDNARVIYTKKGLNS